MREWNVLNKTQREPILNSDLTRPKPVLSNMPTSKGSLNMTQTSKMMAGTDVPVFNKDLVGDGATWSNSNNMLKSQRLNLEGSSRFGKVKLPPVKQKTFDGFEGDIANEAESPLDSIFPALMSPKGAMAGKKQKNFTGSISRLNSK